MARIKVGLANPNNLDDKFTLEYEFVSNSLTEKWLQEFVLFLERDDAWLLERFGGFAKHNRQLPELIRELNKNIELVNSSGKYERMDLVSEAEWSTETHNVVHQHFANLIGQTNDYSEFVQGSDADFWQAVGNINLISHEIETLLSPDPIGAIHTSFLNSRKQYLKPHPFVDSDYDHFTLDWGWGDLVLHYCQLGKVWHEVFLDRDEVIPDTNINPLSYYDGSFDIHFWHTMDAEQLVEFKDWLVKERGQSLNDKKLGLGYVVCGKLILPSEFEGLDDQDRIDFLGRYLYIDRLELVDGELKIEKIITRRLI